MIILTLNSPSLTVKKSLSLVSWNLPQFCWPKNRHRFTACALSPQDSVTPEIPIQNVRKGCWDLDSNNWGIGWGKSQVLEVEIKKPWQLCRTFTNTHTHTAASKLHPAQWVSVPRKTNTRYAWLSSHRTASVIWKWRDCCYPATSLFRSHKWLYGLLIPSWMRETYIQIISDLYICHKLAEIEWAPHWPQYQWRVSHVVFDDPQSLWSTLPRRVELVHRRKSVGMR